MVRKAFTLAIIVSGLLMFVYVSQASFAQSSNDYVETGLSLMNQGSFDDAIAQFNQAIAVDPNNDAAYFDRGLAYIKKGNSGEGADNYDNALVDFDKVLSLIGSDNPHISDVYNSKGNAYHGKGDLEAAVVEYDKAVQANPNDELAWENKGLMNFKMEKYDEAIAAYTKAVALAPSRAEVFLERGAAFMQKADSASDDLALADFTRAIELTPDNGSAYHHRAMIYFLKQEFDKSWSDVRKAQSLGVTVDEQLLAGLKEMTGKEN